MDAILADKAQQQKQMWQAREWTIFCAKTIEAQAPDFWKDLYAAVEGLLEKSGLPPSALHKNPPARFFIHQPRYPAIDVFVDLDTAARTIRITTARRASRETPLAESEQRLPFLLDEAGELYLKQGDTILNVDATAKLILDPFLK